MKVNEGLTWGGRMELEDLPFTVKRKNKNEVWNPGDQETVVSVIDVPQAGGGLGEGKRADFLIPIIFSCGLAWALTWGLGWETLLTYSALSGRTMSQRFRSLPLCLLSMSTQRLPVFKEPLREGGLGTSFQVMWLEFEPINHLRSQKRPCFLGL